MADPENSFTIPSYSNLPCVIPGATEESAGVMTTEQVQRLNGGVTVIQPLDGVIAAPTNVTISTLGTSTFSVVAPAGKTHLVAKMGGVRLRAQPVGDSANLAPGIFAVLQGGTVITPDTDGTYDVTPGATITFSATVQNIFSSTSTPASAPTDLWGVEFSYQFKD